MAIVDDEPIIVLAKTRLMLYPDELRRTNVDGSKVLRLPLSAVKSIELRKVFEPLSFVLLLLGLGIVAIGFYVSSYNWLSCILYVVAAVPLLMGVFGCVGDRIVLITEHGPVVIECPDARGDADCFATSLIDVLKKRSTQ